MYYNVPFSNIFLGCTKNNIKQSLQEQMLTSGIWYYKTRDTVSPDGTKVYGSRGSTACESNSWIKFNADHSDSSLLDFCNSNAAGLYKGAWRLDNDSTIDYSLNGNTIVPNPEGINFISIDSIQVYFRAVYWDNSTVYPFGYFVRFDLNHKK